MDPKLSNLDPKLQDAYNRVMGGAANNPPSPQQPIPQANQSATQQSNYQNPQNIPNPLPPNQNPQPNPAPSVPPLNSNQVNPSINPSVSTAPPPDAMPSSNSTIAYNAENSSKNIGTTSVKKGGLHMLPIAVGMGIVLLLLAYTFIWIIIFNVEIPFIPAF